MIIRPATVEDAPAVLAIYNHEVEHSVVTFDLVPRSLEEQRSWIADRSGAHAAIVADRAAPASAPEVVGFASLSPYRDRPAYATTAETSVYVAADARGQGVGRALLEGIVDTARAHGFHALVARIVGGHEASIRLHESAGFEVVGHEREVGRKFGRWLDVTVAELLL
ncbi:MAG: N-acetyltransferase family protein [Actinomycetota bacterium]|nr:N-acetyltransferase family protein [Actinomycetota bacterium]